MACQISRIKEGMQIFRTYTYQNDAPDLIYANDPNWL